MSNYKDENGTTRVGDFLRGMGDVAKPILQGAAGLTGQTWLDKIANSITTSGEMNEQAKKDALLLLEIDLKDRENARGLQEAALAQNDLFSKRFIYYIAAFWSIVGAAFILVVLFKEIPEANTRLIDTILGFLLGTIVASIITYFFGSSQGSSDKNKMMFK